MKAIITIFGLLSISWTAVAGPDGVAWTPMCVAPHCTNPEFSKNHSGTYYVLQKSEPERIRCTCQGKKDSGTGLVFGYMTADGCDVGPWEAHVERRTCRAVDGKTEGLEVPIGSKISFNRNFQFQSPATRIGYIGYSDNPNDQAGFCYFYVEANEKSDQTKTIRAGTTFIVAESKRYVVHETSTHPAAVLSHPRIKEEVGIYCTGENRSLERIENTLREAGITVQTKVHSTSVNGQGTSARAD